MPATLHPVAALAWINRLSRESEDLDLKNEEGHAVFLYRVASATANVKSYLVANLAETLGYKGPVLNTHAKACRAVADTWIAQN